MAYGPVEKIRAHIFGGHPYADPCFCECHADDADACAACELAEEIEEHIDDIREGEA